MTAIVKPEKFVKDLWNMLESTVDATMPDATSEEKEKAKAAILNSMAGSMFTMEMK